MCDLSAFPQPLNQGYLQGMTMARMNLQGHEFRSITENDPDKEVGHGDADIYVSGYLDAIMSADAVTWEDDYLVLNFRAEAEESVNVSTFEIRGYEEIDALRRYCEMMLELFAAGRLT